MKNLTELVREYKKTKSQALLNDIFSQLAQIIKEKATFIFYKQRFNIKGTVFKLVDTQQIELEDVIQEINLEIVKLINKYDIKKKFEPYLYSTLWKFKPHFINQDFVNQLKNVPSTMIDNEGNEKSILENIEVLPEVGNYMELFENLTEIEKKVVKIYAENPTIKQRQLADTLGLTQQEVSKIMESIRKKVKKSP